MRGRNQSPEDRLGRLLVYRAFRELVRAREEQRQFFERHGIPWNAEEDYWVNLTGNRGESST
jgi:hypothetical protein